MAPWRILAATAALLASAGIAQAQDRVAQWADCNGIFSIGSETSTVSGYTFMPDVRAHGAGPFPIVPEVVKQALVTGDPRMRPQAGSASARADAWVRANFSQMTLSSVWWALHTPECSTTLAAIATHGPASGPPQPPAPPAPKVAAACSGSGNAAVFSWPAVSGAARYSLSVRDPSGSVVFSSGRAQSPSAVDVVPGLAYVVSVTASDEAGSGSTAALPFACSAVSGSAVRAGAGRDAVLFDYVSWCNSPGRDGQPRSPAWIGNCLAANSKDRR